MSKKALTEYRAPEWAQNNLPADLIPSHRIELAMKPTPIKEWSMPGVSEDFQVLIKRDDMTGSSLSGNKIRKLEFILADAIKKGCKHVITCGSTTSNHCRSTAISCAELGLKCHLVLRTSAPNEEQLNYDGNLLLGRLSGAHLHLIENESTLSDISWMEKLANTIKKETGEEAYIVYIGGSSTTGKWGYLDCFQEIRDQGVEFDDLVIACGSGGSAAGMALANYLCGSPYKIHAVLIRGRKAEVTRQVLADSLRTYGLPDVSPDDIMTIHDQYQYPGYDKNIPEHLEFISEIAMETGIILDNCYTGKAAYGLRHLLQNTPEVFRGRRVLFIHTGGIYSLNREHVKSALLPLSAKGKITWSIQQNGI